MRRSKALALIAVFASLNTLLDSIPVLPQLSSGVWYGWIFVIESLNGIILGPVNGFFSTLIGVMVSHSVYFIGEYEYLFTVGAPIGAMVSGLVYNGKLKPVLAYFTVLLTTCFLTPVSWQLPVLGIWDVLLAFVVLCIVFVLRFRFDSKLLQDARYVLPVSALIGLEADILFRIFLLIPCQTYQSFYGFSVEALQAIWGAAAFITPVQVAISMVLTTLIGRQILKLNMLR